MLAECSFFGVMENSIMAERPASGGTLSRTTGLNSHQNAGTGRSDIGSR